MKIKKLIPAVTVLLAAAVLGGCKTKQNNEYDALNKMLDYDYSQIVLTVTNDFGGEAVLVSEYTMKISDSGVTVNYSVERFSGLSLGSTTAEKTTLTGEATVAGGEVTYVSGDEADLGAVTASGGFDFQKDYFENADLTETYLTADVKNPSAFMGSEITCTEMKVKAIFIDRFYEIKINYKSQSGALVEYKYVFKG